MKSGKSDPHGLEPQSPVTDLAKPEQREPGAKSAPDIVKSPVAPKPVEPEVEYTDLTQQTTEVGTFIDNTLTGAYTGVTEVALPAPAHLFSAGVQRVLGSLAIGLAAAIVVSAFDAWQVARVTSEGPLWWRLWVVDLGLMAPLALIVSLVGALVVGVLSFPDAPSLSSLRRWFYPPEARRRARLGAILLVAPLISIGAALLLANVAVKALALEGNSNAVGALLAAAGVGSSLLAIGLVLFVGRVLGIRLRQTLPSPVVLGGVGVAAAVLAVVLLVAWGNTSGAGGPLAIWGVFRRPELDLRAPAMLLVLLVAACAGYVSTGHVRRSVLALLILTPLGLLPYTAQRGLSARATAVSIERSAPLGKIALGILRHLTDRDRDGFSRLFGGGDCNDRNPAINPGADDIPGNGIDEDCSGADLAFSTTPNGKSSQTATADWRGRVKEKLNIVLLTIDTVRADVMNEPRPVVPHLLNLAKRGANFTHAYSPASYTGKSVGPFMIGKNSSETNRDFSHFNAFRKETFVQQRLHDAGVRTISVQGYWYFYSPPYGFEKGFDVIDSLASPGQGYVEGDRTTNADKQADRVLARLEDPANTAGQFFLWAHFTDPHAEYVAHNGFDFGSGQKERYLGEVAFVDAQIGRILEYIAGKEFADRTAVIVTSDHGEAFGEHGMLRHGFEVWEPLVRVPLLIFVPGIEHRDVRARRSLIDLVPTILDLAGAPAPDGVNSNFLSGTSLISDMVAEGQPIPRPVLVDMSAGPNNAERQAYIEGDLKLILSNGRPLGLYNLASDPDERHDLLDQSEERSSVISSYKAFRRALRTVRVTEPKGN